MSSIHPAPTGSIRDRAQKADYAAQVLEAITRIQLAADPAHLLDRLVQATATLGAKGSIFTAAIPEDGLDISCFTLFACDPVIAQIHGNRELLLNHPWFRFAKSHTVPATDHEIRLNQDADCAAVELASRHGFRSCLVVPTPENTPTRRSEMLCVGSDTAGDFEGPEARTVRSLTRALAAELHDWLSRYLQEQLRAAARLRAEDLNLLAFEWQGLGTKEISLRTGMSESSVNSRFQRINVRLRCSNRKYSAQRAAAYGLLETT